MKQDFTKDFTKVLTQLKSVWYSMGIKSNRRGKNNEFHECG